MFVIFQTWCSFRYVPPFLWGKSGHMQTILYGAVKRVKPPFPKGHRCSTVMADGATSTFDIFDPLVPHRSGSKFWLELELYIDMQEIEHDIHVIYSFHLLGNVIDKNKYACFVPFGDHCYLIEFSYILFDFWYSCIQE